MNEGLSAGHTLMALSTLMYAPLPLEEVSQVFTTSLLSGPPPPLPPPPLPPPLSLLQAMNPVNQSHRWYVDAELLKRALVVYPTLQAAVFPSPPTKLTPAESQDVTMYELMKVSHS